MCLRLATAGKHIRRAFPPDATFAFFRSRFLLAMVSKLACLIGRKFCENVNYLDLNLIRNVEPVPVMGCSQGIGTGRKEEILTNVLFLIILSCLSNIL